MNCDLHDSIPDWIVEHPETAAVFAELNLDISCGGKSLEYVCLQAARNVDDVLQRLRETIEKQRPPS
ncbi:hypothetical protein [Fuerstiella marisgermanici]|uniref:Uncharacterized protein n=1 Tax=Fuerstiella marisgermanici TaxID=1891926 RepID=A0A1P8WJP5_9PLAN|nr:hypothetical protein [Fuerstiella marisgermanici]APZ94271.1 hypothetical protein Fuma_03896 [Fuerstiella marisgermanici]